MVIPTLNAASMIADLLKALEDQTLKPDEIIVVDSSSNDQTQDIVCKHPDVKLIAIDRKDFNHGGTRDMALRESKGDFVLFLTQDAMPANAQYIANIMRPFDDEHVALVYGRQLPRDDARAAERLVRSYTYRAQSLHITKEDIPDLGIRAFRATDVCAAYRRTAYLEVGGFENPVLTNEDMFIAARFLNAGWTVVYEADACVVHSHNFTFRQQYKRNYIQGVEIEKHQDILDDAPLTGEGLSMVTYTLKGLARQGHILEAGRFIIDCGFRFVGNRKGTMDARRELKHAGKSE
ncbi:glycosyl transferase family protein [Bifidobacterium cuniculi]|uniref:Glycosyl transferase family protein n=1 Tax=Bifidobacterium cuniculi TaxID=1688 RepID=A0A087AEV8_9BIFI|nr:glycosyl transferase family protein [Bifidobacterium cuniculi]